MNREQAVGTVQGALKRAFDQDSFFHFIRNVLNHIDESKRQTMQVPDAFKEHIRSCQRFATYTAPEGELLDILVVHLTEDYKVERTRTALRDFVAHKLKRGDNYKEAALVAFVPPDTGRWRFSYVRMQYESVRDPKTGTIKPEERLTPARRFSYLVGESESCHTAQTRFLGLLHRDDVNPSLGDIEEAFSVEAVTKEFFGKYAELFAGIHAGLERLVGKDKMLRAEFKDKGVCPVDFSKKLMGQIVFLYFLQKKGWLGVAKGKAWGSGPHDFLRRLAHGQYGTYDNFFNDMLEPLFYDTLATDRGGEAWCKVFKCRIPFLNGGLFEPPADYDWRKTYIALPNSLFTNTDHVEEGVTGTGVFDVFDRYNFTVNEDEPLDKEVAIDPEMLGKVFENLIEENRRKGLGAFYTPREIVHYMCQQSLVNYLDAGLNRPETPIGAPPDKPDDQPNLFIDSSAKDAKPTGQDEFTDIAARPIVPREDLVDWIRQSDQFANYAAAIASGTKGAHYPKPAASIRKYAPEIDTLLRDITVCDPAVGSGAFPVGMMTEIVRARHALNPYLKDLADRSPYHFKRHAIQSCLYGVDIDAGAVEIARLRLWLSLVVDEEQPSPLPNLDYKVVEGNSLYSLPFKSQGLLAIQEAKRQFFGETDHDRKAKLKADIDDRIERLLIASEKSLGYRVKFDFMLYFSEAFEGVRKGFDIVIGNPPYLNVQLVSPEDKDYFARAFKTFYKRFDVFGLFFELGLTRLVHAGTVAFIVPQQIFNNLSYKKLRSLILTNGWLDEVLYLGDKIFDSANNDVCVLFLRKPRGEDIRLVDALDFDNWRTATVAADYFEKYDNIISFSADTSSDALFGKVFDRKWPRVRDSYDVFQGIVTGNNTAFMPTEADIKDASLEKDLLHPVLLGRDFEKWCVRSTARRILYVDKNTDMEAHPNTKEWLQRFKEKLSKRRECQRGVIPWYSLQWPRDKRQLDVTPKIMVQGTRNPRLRTRLVATMDEDCLYGTQGMNFIVPRDEEVPIYYLLGVLNSSLINYMYATKLLNVAIKAEYIKDTPIPKGSSAQRQRITELVKGILATKRRDGEANTTAQEQEIDLLVYTLYGLTEEDIGIVRSTATG